MNNIYTIIFTAFLVLNAQTVEQIKKQIKDAGVTLDQSKQMAKDRGMTDQQIEAEAPARGINLDEAGDGSAPQQTTDSPIAPILDESAVMDPSESETNAEEEMDIAKEIAILTSFLAVLHNYAQKYSITIILCIVV